jgi:hypothetical protein
MSQLDPHISAVAGGGISAQQVSNPAHRRKLLLHCLSPHSRPKRGCRHDLEKQRAFGLISQMIYLVLWANTNPNVSQHVDCIILMFQIDEIVVGC